MYTIEASLPKPNTGSVLMYVENSSLDLPFATRNV